MSYKDGEVRILTVDPFHPVLGQLFPLLLRRMRDFAATHFPEVAPEQQAREYGARAVAGDPNLLLQAFIAPEGKLLGHSVSTVQESYGKRWLFVTQCKVDEPAGDLMHRAIGEGMQFARARGAEFIVFETKRSDSAWAKAYGFKTMRHLMMRSLNGPEVTEERVASE